MPPDRTDPEAAVARTAKAYSNWGRRAEDDVLGTLNFLDEEKRRTGAALARRGVSFPLSPRFDIDGPQKGWHRRTNPVHTMLDTGTDAALANQGLPHGIGGADDVITMPLQCSTQCGLGLLLATTVGSTLGSMLLRMTRTPVALDWGSVLTMTGGGGAVVGVVTLLSVPPLLRMMRPEALRTE